MKNKMANTKLKGNMQSFIMKNDSKELTIVNGDNKQPNYGKTRLVDCHKLYN